GEARWFYADLLEYVDREIFGDVPGVISRIEMLEALREFTERQGREIPIEDDQGAQAPPGIDARAFAAYRRLVDTGWLIEFRDRYRRVVDMNANARLVLTTLLEIKAGRTRSYGGEVLQVLLQLEGPIAIRKTDRKPFETPHEQLSPLCITCAQFRAPFAR